MSLYLLDTDIVSLLERGNPVVLQRINQHTPADMALSVITIREQMQGSLAAVNSARTEQAQVDAYDRIAHRLLPVWQRFAVISLTLTAMKRYHYLRSLRLNVGPMDLRIAAIALENGLIVVTRNHRDFSRVQGLAIEDWSV